MTDATHMTPGSEQEARIMSELDRRFEAWWNEEGSAPPALPMDWEEHTRLISRLAWHNGAYVARSVSPSESYASDGEREAFARWLDGRGAMADLGVKDSYFRAAALLRQLPPDGLEAIRYCVEEDGAVIQRTSRAPESWAIRSCSSCMSTTGEWDIEPMPSDRTDEWLANHRWPSAAAAWAALQQARQQEVGDE